MRPHLSVGWLGVVRRNDLIMRALEKNFSVEETEDAAVVFCGEGMPPRRADASATTFFVPTELCWPPLSQYDYSFGFLHLDRPRYHRLPNYVLEYSAESLIKDGDFAERAIAQQRQFCSFVVSNGNPRRTFQRIHFFDELNSKRQVSSAGKMFNNVAPIQPGTDALHNFIRDHRFHIAMENKAWRGYTTEKITSAMAAGAIPIYWGDPLVETEFNPASFIHLRRYPSLSAGRDAVLRLADDRDALVRILREPWFHANRQNAAYSIESLAEFLKYSITTARQSKRRYFPTTWSHKSIEKLTNRLANLAYRFRAARANDNR